MTFIISFLPYLLNFCTGYVFSQLIQSFAPLRKQTIWKWLALFGYWCVFSTISYFSEELIVTVGTFFFFALIPLLAHQGNLFQKWSIILILYPVIQGINYLSFNLGFEVFKFTGEKPFLDGFILTASFILKFLLWWGIGKIFKGHIKDCQTFLTNKMWGIMAVISLASFISLISIVTFTPQQEYYVYPAVIACVVTGLGIIYIAGYITETLKVDMENQQLKLQKTYYEELARNQLEIRKISHDLNHHLSVIATLLETGETQKLQDYFNQLSVQFTDQGRAFCQNSLVNAVINSKFQQIQQQQIDTFINIDIDQLLTIDDISLCALFANTIDNAIEAVLGINNPEERKISIEARYTKGYFSYNITNSKHHSLIKDANGLVTTKKDKASHGFGLKTVKGIVDKYNGTFDMAHTEREFSLVILMSNV